MQTLDSQIEYEEGAANVADRTQCAAARGLSNGGCTKCYPQAAQQARPLPWNMTNAKAPFSPGLTRQACRQLPLLICRGKVCDAKQLHEVFPLEKDTRAGSARQQSVEPEPMTGSQFAVQRANSAARCLTAGDPKGSNSSSVLSSMLSASH